MKYLVSYLFDDSYETEVPQAFFDTLDEAKEYILEDYFENDKEMMDEWKHDDESNGKIIYEDDCKGAIITCVPDKREKCKGKTPDDAKPCLRKLNGENNYESIGTFKLSKEKTPIAFAEKVAELMEEEDMSEEEAEECVSGMEFDLEVYYERGFGLFAVETDAVDSVSIRSPYSGELYECWDEEE